jgi:hypothetical protein
VPLLMMWIALMRLTMTKNSIKALTKKNNLWHIPRNKKKTSTDETGDTRR